MNQDDQQSSWSVQAIGRVSSTRTEAIDDDWGGITAAITLLQPFGPDALVGLDEFSHLEVIYLFDRVDPDTVNRGARIPRNNPAWPAVGIFAQRAKNRPNRLGLATCELVERRRAAPCGCGASTPSTARPCSTSSRTWPSSGPGARSPSRPGPTS